MMLGCIQTKEKATPTWEMQLQRAKIDLTIKKIAIVVIALLNFAGLCAAAYYFMTYCPYKLKALIVSPIVIGVLGALSTLKVPTFGVKQSNITSYANPLHMIGKGLGYLFFGPFSFSVKHLDWTPYHDPTRANTISHDLSTKTFAELARDYGSRFGNLIKYGFINPKKSDALKTLYKTYKNLKREKDFWTCEKQPERVAQTQKKIEQLEKKWAKIKKNWDHPTLAQPTYDFTSWKGRLQLMTRRFFVTSNPNDWIKE